MTTTGKVKPGRKWTPGQRAKFIASMKAKRANGHTRAAPKADVRAAILHLRRAEADYVARLRDGRLRHPDRSHTLLTLALQALEDPT